MHVCLPDLSSGYPVAARHLKDEIAVVGIGLPVSKGAVTASPPRLRIVIATMPGHHVPVNRFSPKLTTVLLCLACVLLSSCAGRTAGEHIADMPHWMGGEPEGVPPRPGTPEYDAWMAARAQEAARPKNGQTKTDPSKTDQGNGDNLCGLASYPRKRDCQSPFLCTTHAAQLPATARCETVGIVALRAGA